MVPPVGRAPTSSTASARQNARMQKKILKTRLRLLCMRVWESVVLVNLEAIALQAELQRLSICSTDLLRAALLCRPDFLTHQKVDAQTLLQLCSTHPQGAWLCSLPAASGPQHCTHP